MSVPINDQLRGLDYLAPQYDREWFLQMARNVQSGASLTVAASCFLQLAETPAAIAALNHHKPQVPRAILGLNRALHYLVRLELLGDNRAKDARSAVAHLWHVEPTTVKEDVHLYGDKARHLLEEHVEEGLRAPNLATRAEFLRTLDIKMQRRAVRMSTQRLPRK